MSKLRLPLADRFSSVPDIDRKATGWAALLTDTLEKWGRGGIGADNIADLSITSAQIADGTIATVDLADGSVTSAKILDGTIVSADVATGTFLQLLVTGTARKVAFGKVTSTFGGATDFSGVVTVTHGLGGTPSLVLGTFSQSSGVTKYPSVQVFNVGATTFQTNVNTIDGQVPAAASTAGIYWLAIG